MIPWDTTQNYFNWLSKTIIMKNTINKWFTLIEVIVSISILSMIMVSVFMIFLLSADLNNKTDISRSLQENIKNFVEVISKDVRENDIGWVNSDVVVSNCKIDDTEKFLSGTKLCVGWNSYYLAKEVSGVFNRVWDYNECQIGKESCYLVKNDGVSVTQLSNSWVEFRNLYFYVTNKWQKKVTISFEVQPSIRKWVKMELIKDNTIQFQTTLSQRLYNN